MRNLQLLDHIFFLALIACVALSTTATLAQQKSTSGNIVGLAMGFKPSHYLLSLSGRPMRDFNGIVQTFMGTVVCFWRKCFDRLNVTG